MNWETIFANDPNVIQVGPSPRQPVFSREQLPGDVLAMLDDPKRPTPTRTVEATTIAQTIVRACEVGRHLIRDTEPDEHDDYGPDKERRVRWQDGRLKALGYTVGAVAPNGFDFRRPGGYRYEDGVLYGLLELLMPSVRAFEAELKATEVSDDEAEAIEHIPTDAGLSLDEIASLLGLSTRRARGRVNRWAEQGLLRVEEVPSPRGGSPKKQYVRIDSEEAIEGDLDGDDDGDQ